jgi:hypothetical protein
MEHNSAAYIRRIVAAVILVTCVAEALWHQLLIRDADLSCEHAPMMVIGVVLFIWGLAAFGNSPERYYRYLELSQLREQLNDRQCPEDVRIIRQLRRWERGIAAFISLLLLVTAFAVMRKMGV